MRATEIKSCYIGPQISPEQFYPEHFFLFLAKGKINGYDGGKHAALQANESCLVRKNRLGRYNKQKVDDEFEKVVIVFDEKFLKSFQRKHAVQIIPFDNQDTFVRLPQSSLIPNFIH